MIIYVTRPVGLKPKVRRLVLEAESLRPHPEACEFLDWQYGRSPGTADQYASHLKTFLNWAASRGYDLATAGRHLDAFQGMLRSTAIDKGRRSQGRVRSEVTRANVLAAVRAFYAWLIREQRVPESLSKRIWAVNSQGKTVPVNSEAGRRRRAQIIVPSGAQLGRLLAVLTSVSPRDHLIYTLLAQCGLRRGAVAGIRRPDVHAVADASAYGLLDPFYVQQGRRVVCPTQGPHVHIVRRLDNPNGARHKSHDPLVVPLPALTLDALDRYYVQRLEVLGAHDDNDMLLLNLGDRRDPGRAIGMGRINDLLTAWAKKADIPGLTPHLLRHQFATVLVDAGERISTVQELLGHASEATTRAVYVHVSDAQKRAAVARTAHLVGGIRK